MQARSSRAAEIAEIALQAWPVDPELLLLAALTALASEQPERAHAVLKRYGKRYPPGKAITLLTSLALAQQGKQDQVWALLQAAQLETDRAAIGWFVGDGVMEDWLLGQLRAMRRLGRRPPGPSPRAARPAKPAPTRVSIPRPPAARAVSPAGPVLPIVVDLPRLQARFDIACAPNWCGSACSRASTSCSACRPGPRRRLSFGCWPRTRRKEAGVRPPP